MPRLPNFHPGAYVASALEQTLAQTAQGPPLDPITLLCAVVAHHLSLRHNRATLFHRAWIHRITPAASSS